MEIPVNASTRVCLIGLGEVGKTLAADLLARGYRNLATWDILFPDVTSQPRRAAAELDVRRGASAQDAVAGAQVVISAVTAAQDVAAATSVAAHLDPGAFFLDLNSVSPGVKQHAADLITAAGARYVEAAIMSPIGPKRIASPMLFGGPHAAEFAPLAHELGFSGAKVFSDRIGRASAAKMCRSVVVKGVEALLGESLLTARRYGVENTVIESLENLFPAANWRTLARYMISRSLIHGRRRAEEMREAAQTVSEAGIGPWMSSASAQRQEWAAQFRACAAQEELQPMLDALLAAVDAGEESSQC
jgi:3-hydroxyisobutyrate dehydrogenase-like beta-hydroxyacid dehydrogenase